MSMTIGQIQDFLAERRHAVVATNRPAGPPQLSPVWYLYDDGRFYISAGMETAKVHNLRRDPRISLCVDGGYPDGRCVMAHGTATLIGGDDPRRDGTRRRILHRYHDDEDAVRRHVESTRGEEMVIIVVTPQKILSQDFN